MIMMLWVVVAYVLVSLSSGIWGVSRAFSFNHEKDISMAIMETKYQSTRQCA